MNKKDQVQFLLLLSSCYCLTKEIPPTKANVLDTIQDNEWAYFSQHDLEINIIETNLYGEIHMLSRESIWQMLAISRQPQKTIGR